MHLALLHPGAMGSTVGQSLVDAGHIVSWLAEGRSAVTQARAVQFQSFATLSDLINAKPDGIISVCPPAAALATAQMVANALAEAEFKTIYVDANAVAPITAATSAEWFGEHYVDGGIIGPPALQAGTTRLYLSGPRAAEVARWFSAGAIQAIALSEGGLTATSALKMAYAAQTKGSSALLMLVNAMAEQAGVHDALQAEWALSQPDLQRGSERTAARIGPAAWRFAGEMEEIAATCTALGLSADFHHGAAAIYASLADLKGRSDVTLAEVIEMLARPTV